MENHPKRTIKKKLAKIAIPFRLGRTNSKTPAETRGKRAAPP
jgi:hypothetical protein